MRRILIENARRRQRRKHGGDYKRVTLDDVDLAIEDSPDNLIALDEALTKLARVDKDKSELVELRYFAGLTLEQTAGLLRISRTTAKRRWMYARAWLYREISEGDQTDHP